jgi:multiple sugar transport system permease protein
MAPIRAFAPRTRGTGVGPRGSSRARRETVWFFVFIAPWLVGFVGLSVVPLVFGFLLSFSNYDGLNLNTLSWVGLENYARAFEDPDVLHGLTRTIVYAGISVPLNLAVGFALAIVLTRRLLGRAAFRTLFYVPSVIPLVAVAWIWKLMMNTDTGLVNSVIDLVSPGTVIAWLTDHSTLVLVILSLWISTGGSMLIFLAGLQNVPKDLEDAARVDGANVLQVFRAVTLPMMTPVVFFQLVLGIIGALQVLVEPILLASDMDGQGLSAVPPRPNYLYMVHTFSEIFTFQRFGYGLALIWLLFVLILLLTVLVFRTGRYWVYYETEQEGVPR